MVFPFMYFIKAGDRELYRTTLVGMILFFCYENYISWVTHCDWYQG